MEAYQVQLLNIVRYQLFGGDKPETETAELHTILTEAKVQTVFTMVFPFLRNSLMKDSPECFVKDNEIFLRNVIMNTANFLEHDELETRRGAYDGIAAQNVHVAEAVETVD